MNVTLGIFVLFPFTLFCLVVVVVVVVGGGGVIVFVLFCFVLFCFLFCFVLFCFVLFCFVLFIFFSFCPFLSSCQLVSKKQNVWKQLLSGFFLCFCFVLFCFCKVYCVKKSVELNPFHVCLLFFLSSVLPTFLPK